MSNPEQLSPEKISTAEKQDMPKTNAGDLALFAEFQSDNTALELEKAKKENNQRGIDRLTTKFAREVRIQMIFEKLQEGGNNNLDKAMAEIDRQNEDVSQQMDGNISNEKFDELNIVSKDYEEARKMIDNYKERNIYERKDFSDWLTKHNEQLRQRRQKEAQRKKEAILKRDTERAENVYDQLGVESPAEREKMREKAADLVLRDGGIRINTSIKKDLSPKGHSGFQNLETRLQDSRNPVNTLGLIRSQFLTPEDFRQGKGLEKKFEEHGIKEIIDIRHDVKPAYETTVIPGRKGVLGIGKKEEQTIRRPTGNFEPVFHNEIVSGGKNESAVRFSYFIPQTEWRDYTGRTGQALSAEIVLPESTAREVEKILENDPAAMRRIVERIMKEKLLKDSNAWERPQGNGDALCPPYEKWDSLPDGGKIYLQKEEMKPGFHQEALRKVQK